MSRGKFVIDGKIEGNANPVPVQKKSGNRLLRLKAWILVLSIISTLFLALAFYLFIQTEDLQSEKMGLRAELNTTDKLLSEKMQLLSALEKTGGEMNSSPENNVSEGVYFEVQIGSFKNFNLDAYASEMVNLYQDKNEAGTRICLGRFRSAPKAVEFEKEVKKLGFTSAFVIGRVNGELKDYEETLRWMKENGVK